MVEEKLAQQIYNVLEKSYETFYHVVFLEVCKSYGITPIGFNIKKTPLLVTQVRIFDLYNTSLNGFQIDTHTHIYIYILFCCFHLYLVIEHFLMNHSYITKIYIYMYIFKYIYVNIYICIYICIYIIYVYTYIL